MHSTHSRVPMIMAMLMITVGLLPLAIPQGDGSDIDDMPSRGLAGYKETLNVSFPKPILYSDSDPHYNHENLEANTWDDLAFVVLLQDKNTVKKNENQGSSTSTAQCSDIYQAAFVPLDGSSVSTGTQQRIMVEDFTATWCGYCTGVIGAMNRLDFDDTMWPEKYIGVEWHSGGGTYGVGTPLSSAVERRDSYELSGGIPRYVIDGMDPYVGGSTSANASSIDSRIRSSISSRSAPAQISIMAHAGHTASNAWVEFTFTVEDSSFDNEEVEAHVFLVQDAYPRRHGTNPTARLGWIGQDLYTQDVMQLEAPSVQFFDSSMQNDIAVKGYVEGEFEVKWQATDKEDQSNLEVDLYYRTGHDDWIIMAEDVPNTGRYTWRTHDPRVPDNEDYQIKIIVTDSNDMVTELESAIRFDINNPDPPIVTVRYPLTEGEVLTGTGEVKWRTWDGEQTPDQMTIDLWISGDLGETFEQLASNLDNVGYYEFDTTGYDDGTDYVVKIKATDITGLENETITLQFEIFNNDIPSAVITYPVEDEMVSGEIEVTWDSLDEEDDPGEMTYDLYLKYIDDGVWTRIASDKQDTGSFTLDTATMEFGDGDYQLRLIMKDTHGEYSDQSVISFKVYNPDAPLISNTVAPRSPVSGTVVFSYELSDPDRGEGMLLTPSFYLLSGGEWVTLSENSSNIGTYELDVTDMEDTNYQLKIVVFDPVEQNLFTEFIYPDFTVNNPDAPTLEALSLPSTGDNLTGEIGLSWSGADLDGDTLRYYLYYSSGSDPSWYPISDALGITTGSHVWNVSEMETGEYRIKVLVKDGSRASLEAELVSGTFTIYTPKEVDDRNTEGENSGKSGSSSDDSSSLFILILVGIIVIVLLLIGMVVLVLVRRRQQPAGMQAAPGPNRLPGVASGNVGLPPQQVSQQLPPTAGPNALPPGPPPTPPAVPPATNTPAPAPAPETVAPVQAAPVSQPQPASGTPVDPPVQAGNPPAPETQTYQPPVQASNTPAPVTQTYQPPVQ